MANDRRQRLVCFFENDEERDKIIIAPAAVPGGEDGTPDGVCCLEQKRP
jgi:hypothetical protein